MIKLSRTGITALKRQYKSVLLKCLLINAGILLATNVANAADTVSVLTGVTSEAVTQVARSSNASSVTSITTIYQVAPTQTNTTTLYTTDKIDSLLTGKANADLDNLSTAGTEVITTAVGNAISDALVEGNTPGAIAAYVTDKSYQNATQVSAAISNALADYSTTAQMNTALAGKQNTIDADHKLSSTLVSFTTDETAVLGSGITSAKVSTYDGYATQIAGKLAGEEAGDYTVTGARGEALAQKIATYVTDNGTKFADVKNTANIITELFNDKALYMQETTGMDQAHSVEYNYNHSSEDLLHGATSMLNADEILAGAIDDKLDKTSSTTAGATMELENADGLFVATGSSTGYSNQLTIDNGEDGIKLSANDTNGVGKKSSLDITSEGIFYNKGATPSDNDEIVTLNTAADAVYNNTTSGLTATTIQGAIDETNAKFTDGSVDAKFKTVTTTGTATIGGKLTVSDGGASIKGDTAVDGALSATGNISSSTGNIIATTGNIIATAGNITATAGSVTAGTGVIATTGNITATAGNLVATAGNVEANNGSVSGKTLKNANSTFTVAENGDLAVSKSTTEYVKLNADGTMSTSGAATIGGDLKVGEKFSVTAADGAMSAAGGNLTVDANGAITSKSWMSVAGGKMTVNSDGAITSKSWMSVADGKMTVDSNGAITSKSWMSVADGKMTVNSDGAITSKSWMSVADGKFTVSSDGNTNVGGTLTVAKAATLNDTLDVAGLTTLSADNGMRFGTGQVVKSIDAGVDAQTNPNPEALATVATVLKSAENADYTGTTLDATGNRPATVKDGLNLIGNVNSFAGGRHIAGAETLADATVALDKGLSRLEDKVRDFKKEFKSGMAQMAAMSALVPNARAHGNTQISVGTGAYEGQTAAAIGGFHWVNDNLMLNIGASYGDSNNMAYRAGLTWSW